MVLWFLTLAALGIPHILADTHVLGALSPHHAVGFAFRHPFIAFIAMGAVVLSVTGAEALYADMGHFGSTLEFVVLQQAAADDHLLDLRRAFADQQHRGLAV